MFKAASLVYAMVISVILAMLSSSLILLSYFTTSQIEYYSEMNRVQLNASSGMRLLLAEQKIINSQERKSLDLFGKGVDSVILEKRNWGAFEIGISNAYSKHHQFQQIAMMGGAYSEDSTIALYLEDEDKPLSLCGKTVLKGTCVLPKAGVKRAYIEGQNFVGERLVDGRTIESEKQLPAVSKMFLENITSFFMNHPNEEDNVVVYEETKDSVVNSFVGNTIFLFSPDKIKIEKKKMIGNVVIISQKEIEIASDAILQDIIIYAPRIKVGRGFSGSLQIFASDTLVVEEDCKFIYPSVLGLFRTEKSVDNPAMILNEKVEVKGVVLGYQDKFDNRKNLSISIDNGCVIIGHVYCNGLLDLKGTVYGSVFCRKFILKTPSSVYENHLLNAVIDRTLLPTYFVGFGLFEETKKKEIVKWLN